MRKISSFVSGKQTFHCGLLEGGKLEKLVDVDGALVGENVFGGKSSLEYC